MHRAPVRLLIVAACTALFGAHTALAGFGITPPYVRNDKLTLGSTYTQEIVLVRGDPVEDLKAEVTVNVPGIDSWITVDRGNEFLLPKGEKQVPIRVTVRVPQETEYKQYKGNIRIRTLSPDPTSGVSIALGAQLDVDLRVVDQIRDFEVKRVAVSEVEEPRRIAWLEFPGKITFTMGIANTGNAPTAPSRVKLELYDKRGSVVLETTQNTNTIEPVLPFETREVVAYLPTRLPPGAYLVRYTIYQYDDVVKRSGELTLSVLPRGTLAAYAGYGLEGLSLGDQLSLALPLALILLLLLAAVFVLHLRRRNRRHAQRRARHEARHRDPPGGGDSSTGEQALRQPGRGGVVDLKRRG